VEARPVEVDDGQVVLPMESFHHRRAHLARADDDDPHGAEAIARLGRDGPFVR
jgi:hypothetical protein